MGQYSKVETDGRLMIVNRAHHAMVDGLAHRDIMTTMFDGSPEGSAVEPPPVPWRPRPAPGDLALVWHQLKGLWFGPPDPGPGPLIRIGLWLAAWRGFLQLGLSVITPPKLRKRTRRPRSLVIVKISTACPPCAVPYNWPSFPWTSPATGSSPSELRKE